MKLKCRYTPDASEPQTQTHANLHKLAASKLRDGNFNHRFDRELISYSLVWVAYLTIYGDEGNQR